MHVLLKTGAVLSNREISRTFNVCTRRGIRYSGSLKTGIRHVVLTTVLSKTPEESVENPYNDRFEGESLLYTGEGRLGNQRMERGNLALKMQMEKRFPIFVFEKKTPGKYVFLGQYDVVSVQTEKQPDAHGKPRKVFIFRLEKASDSASLPIKTLKTFRNSKSK
ncbi:MAG: YDG/SRA domain-containing protein [Candidatus Bathyarchaeota archaeon]|nr:YDG/SRA domain-containing protein [Candidatus Bathyarchaeota archaeon]MDW8040682.1 YDG/SRA domain-containing protein [Nitrososphaerota archaeon]